MAYSLLEGTMACLAWPEIDEAAKAGAVVLLPTGVMEEHGPHMSIGVDACCSYLACRETASRLNDRGIGTLIAPPCYWGMNTATSGFPGSFTVRRETWRALLLDILGSLKSWGFEHVFNLNWHGDLDHNMVILEVLLEARNNLGLDARAILRDFDARRFKLSGREPNVLVRKRELREADQRPPCLEIHADSLETGVMARYFPEHVNVQLARRLAPTELQTRDLAAWSRGGAEASALAPDGYFGNPAGFDLENAKERVESSASDTADLVEAYLKGAYEPPANL